MFIASKDKIKFIKKLNEKCVLVQFGKLYRKRFFPLKCANLNSISCLAVKHFLRGNLSKVQKHHQLPSRIGQFLVFSHYILISTILQSFIFLKQPQHTFFYCQVLEALKELAISDKQFRYVTEMKKIVLRYFIKYSIF